MLYEITQIQEYLAKHHGGKTVLPVATDRCKMAGMANKISDIIELHALAETLGLPSTEETWDRLAENGYAWEVRSQTEQEVLADGATQEEAEERGMQAEQEVLDEEFKKVVNAIEGVADKLFAEHGLVLTPVKYGYKITPEKSWNDAATLVMDTINGVGQFEFRNLREFLDSGPYTARQAVLSHLHWIKRRPDVYGDRSAETLYYAALR